jgi:hypothetical protein
MEHEVWEKFAKVDPVQGLSRELLASSGEYQPMRGLRWVVDQKERTFSPGKPLGDR